MRMRKKKHLEDRVRMLSDLIIRSDYIDSFFTSEFYNEKPIRLELGCGKGDFICALSIRDPSFNYLAVDKVTDVLVSACEKYSNSRNIGNSAPNGGWIYNNITYPYGSMIKISDDKKGNVRFTDLDVGDLCKRIPPSTISDIYINFCDPWTKNKNTQRRLTSHDFLNEYAMILKENGTINFKTDNLELYDFSLNEFSLSKDFCLLETSDDLYNTAYISNNISTEYERSFISKGITIKHIKAMKNKIERD